MNWNGKNADTKNDNVGFLRLLRAYGQRAYWPPKGSFSSELKLIWCVTDKATVTSFTERGTSYRECLYRNFGCWLFDSTMLCLWGTNVTRWQPLYRKWQSCKWVKIAPNGNGIVSCVLLQSSHFRWCAPLLFIDFVNYGPSRMQLVRQTGGGYRKHLPLLWIFIF